MKSLRAAALLRASTIAEMPGYFFSRSMSGAPQQLASIKVLQRIAHCIHSGKILIQALRERSGAPIADVKLALQEASWDMGALINGLGMSLHCHPTDAAFEALRKKGLAAATKKAGRHAAEGLVGLAQQGTRVAIIEVCLLYVCKTLSATSPQINSETDFAARNPQFLQLVGSVAASALHAPTNAEHCIDEQALKAQMLPSGSRYDGASV